MKGFALSLCVSVGFFALTLVTVRRKVLRDQMAVLWLGVSGLMLLLSFTLPFHLLDHAAHVVGVAYGSDLILLAAVLFLVVLVFQLSIAVARLSATSTRLAQEIALLHVRAEPDRADRTDPTTASAPVQVPVGGPDERRR